jgi:hypothetical protein
VRRSITAGLLIGELDRLATVRGYRAVLHCDNSPELASQATTAGPVNASACLNLVTSGSWLLSQRGRTLSAGMCAGLRPCRLSASGSRVVGHGNIQHICRG